MMTYNEKSKQIEKTTCFFDFSFFVPMSQEMLNFKFREFSGTKVINLRVPEEFEFKS